MNKPYLAWLIQFLAWPFIFIWSKIFNTLKVYGRENIKGLSGPLIIASNHPSFWGSFLSILVLGSSSNLLPVLGFGTYDVTYTPLKFLKKIRVIWAVYKLFGVIPVVKGKGLEIALAKPQEIIKGGGVIGIYPEGRLNHGKEILPFKHGAAALSYMTDVPILPVAIKMVKGKYWRTKYSISFGKPEKMPVGLSYDLATEYLHSIISELYDRIKP